jgi:hypothetical protein
MQGIEIGAARAVQASAAAQASARRAVLGRVGVIGGMVATIWLLALSRWIAIDAVVPWDSKNQFYAFFRFLASALQSGASPFWNPYHYGGHPAVADPQSLIFAPVFFLWALFDPLPSVRAFDVVVYAHLLAGGLALAALGLRANWPAAACVLGAVVFMFGGAAAGRLQHTGIILTYAMFPPALLLLELALQRRSILYSIAFSIVVSMLLLGRNQVALLMGVVLAAVLLREIVSAESRLRYLRERAVVLALMTVVVVALVAAPTLLTMQFAALSNRPVVALASALEGSLYPANLANLVVANVFGSHNADFAYWGPNYETVPAVASTDQSFNYLFVGWVPMVILLWFGIVGGGAWQRGRRLFTGVLVVALLFALGRYTPLFGLAFDWMPAVSMFRRPVDANFVILTTIAILTGFLLADYVRHGLPPRRILRSVVVVAGALAIITWAIALSGRTGHAGAAFIEILKVAPIPILVIAALAVARTEQSRVWAAGIVVAVAVAELLWWNAASRLNAEDRPYYTVLERPTGENARAIEVLVQAVREAQRNGEYPRIEVIGLGGPWQNLAVALGLEATNGYNPLRIGVYDRLISPGETTYDISQRKFPASFDGYDCALARVLGLGFLVLDRPIERLPSVVRRPNAELLHGGPDVWIYKLQDPTPRLKFIGRVQVADAEAVTATGRLLIEPAPDRALIDVETPLSRPYWAADLDVGRAQIVAWRPDRIEIDVQSDHGGVLVLHDVYYPGWIAEIDGKEVPIVRADVLFSGVEVRPGQHRIVFQFAPFSLANLSRALDTVLHNGDRNKRVRRTDRGNRQRRP